MPAQIKFFMIMYIISIIITIIFVLDTITFIVQSFGNGSNFTYYICRPLWGLISGSSIGMAIGFVVRISEVAFSAIVLYTLIMGWIS